MQWGGVLPVGCFRVRTEGEEKEPRHDDVNGALLSGGGARRGRGSRGGCHMEGGNGEERGGHGRSVGQRERCDIGWQRPDRDARGRRDVATSRGRPNKGGGRG
jgi:hypothetical protein